MWKKWIPTLMDKFERFKNPIEEITADAMGVAREIELEMKPDNETKFLQSYDKTLTNEELLLNEPRNRFLEMELTAGEELK